MTEPQVWVLIGTFAAAMFGVLGITTSMIMRVIRTEVGSLRAEIGGVRSEVSGQIGGLAARLDAFEEKVDARFDAVNTRLDYLDRDVQLLMKREFGES